jgi:outer membrane lipopolysaccharide assembly protein LptE/RlpB
MKRIFLLAVIGGLTLCGWAFAQQQEMLNHGNDVHMEKMQYASCQPSSSSGGQ